MQNSLCIMIEVGRNIFKVLKRGQGGWITGKGHRDTSRAGGVGQHGFYQDCIACRNLEAIQI